MSGMASKSTSMRVRLVGRLLEMSLEDPRALLPLLQLELKKRIHDNEAKRLLREGEVLGQSFFLWLKGSVITMQA